MPGPHIALFSLCLYCFSAVCADQFTYKEIDRGTASRADFTVARVKNGYTISVQSTKDSGGSKQELICDSTFATLSWHYKSASGTDISFLRNADRIALSGVFKGKQVRKDLTIDTRPWYQIVPLGLQTVSGDGAGSIKFWAVSLEEPARLKAVCFLVTNTDTASMPGRPEVACRCFHVKIEGLLTCIWAGEYFIRCKDNVFVYYQGFLYAAKKPSGTIEAVPR